VAEWGGNTRGGGFFAVFSFRVKRGSKKQSGGCRANALRQKLNSTDWGRRGDRAWGMGQEGGLTVPVTRVRRGELCKHKKKRAAPSTLASSGAQRFWISGLFGKPPGLVVFG